MNFSRAFLLQFLFISLTHLTISSSLSTNSQSQPWKELSEPDSSIHGLDNILHKFSQWRNNQLYSSQTNNQNLNTIIAYVLCCINAAISSAGGVGGGSLFLPILTIVTGFSLKTATSFSAFMVSAGALCNIIYTFCFLDRSLVNYEITLLSQPGMLLGVSIGVLCNFMFPEWLIMALFAAILAISTVKTVQSGCKLWSNESEKRADKSAVEESDTSGAGTPLLMNQRQGNGAENLVPWKDLMVLVMIWMCFFVLHLLLGNKNGQGLIDIKPCGVAYWLITLSQIPIAIGFTSYLLKRNKHGNASDASGTNKASVAAKSKYESLPKYVFPLAALLTGALSGLFGIGGGLMLSPAFLQIGLPPQAAAATSSLMVLFSASMSMVQYILLGTRRVDEAVKYALICLAASVVGLVIMNKIIANSGRVSLVVFLVGLIMALSTIIITLFGVLDVWRQITDGDYMGFKLLC